MPNVPDRLAGGVVHKHSEENEVPALHELDSPAGLCRDVPEVGLIGGIADAGDTASSDAAINDEASNRRSARIVVLPELG